MSSIAEFSTAHASLQKALGARGYTTPTPVQAAILAPDVAGRDLLVSAQTGSGKTVAFGLALATTLLGEGERFEKAGAPRALIVTPTRELALQVHRELTWLFADTGARLTTCVGGMDPRRESSALSHGVHIVVGTPGRLCDHLARGSLVLERVAAVVLDEADEMLDMGFREDLERLLDAAPRERRTLLFSATIPPPIAQMAKRYQQNALRVAATADGGRHHDIAYQVVSIVPRERDLAVVNLLRYHAPPGALVFCGTRDGVTHLAANLSERGFSVAALSGELSQRERNQALQALRDGRARVCVATDVAARGLDLPNLDLVIHADLPQNKETLVHRSGRTGRAGKKGLAIIVAVDAARRFVERLLQSARIEATWGLPPSADDIHARDATHLASEITELTGELSDADRSLARTLLAERPAEDLVAALVRVRRDARPAPEELTLPASMRPRDPRDARDSRGPRGPLERPRSRYDHVRGPRHDEPRGAHPRHDEPRASFGRHDEPRGMHARHDEPRGAFARHDSRPAGEPARHDDRPAREQDARPSRERHDSRPAVESAREPELRTEEPGAEQASQAPAERARPLRPADHARSAAEHARGERAPFARAERPVRGNHELDRVWFTINVGRSKNADPKWLIPLLCRRGGISKNAIGKIQIFARETRVEISHDVSERFAAAVRQPDTQDRNIHIEPLDDGFVS